MMFSLRVVFALIVLAWSCPTWADTGFISSGGAAHLLTENKSVTMQSEVVKIHVSDGLIRADCCFFFVNKGPACKVRMGFPDQSSVTQGKFLSYKTYVDGKEVETETIGGDGPNIVWHANNVEFAANERKTVRDIYTVSPGKVLLSQKTSDVANIVTYILHTASSWHGYIGKADIIISFDKVVLPQPLRGVSFNTLPQDETNVDQALTTPNTFVYCASKAPEISGQTVHFKFANLRPSNKDDILIFYGRTKVPPLKFPLLHGQNTPKK